MKPADPGTVEPVIVLFDGACAFCARATDFMARRDPEVRFRFCTSQSPRGQAILRSHGFDGSPGSIVLIEGGHALTHSTATLRIARLLPWPWRGFYAFVIIPRPLRDWAYGVVARHRQRWLDRSACAVPSAELRARLLK